MSNWTPLSELGKQYREAAEPIRKKLAELRAELRRTSDPEKVWHLKRRIAELTPILSELNMMAECSERYYERGYYRNEQITTNGIKYHGFEGRNPAKTPPDSSGGVDPSGMGYRTADYSRGKITTRGRSDTGRKPLNGIPKP